MRSIFLVLLLSSLAQAEAIRSVTTPAGTHLESFEGVEARGPVRPMLDDPEILWSYNYGTAIVQSVAISLGDYCYSGNSLNAPREAAKYEITGNGAPIFAQAGTDWHVAADPGDEYWIAADRSDADSSLTLYYFPEDEVSSPWTYDLGNSWVGGNDVLQVCEDGSTMAACVTFMDNTCILYVWQNPDVDSIPDLIYTPLPENQSGARAMQMSADGSIIAFTAGVWLHIVETATGVARNIINTQASVDGLALSADGSYVLTAFQAAVCRHWNGTTYDQIWSVGLNQRYCSQLLISPDNDYAVSFWYNSSYNQNYIRVHELETGITRWSYTYPAGGTGVQDWPIDCDITADGNWFAVGTWGNINNANGEAQVYSRYYNQPYYYLNMAGSCWDMDLSSDGRYLITGGKHVHANQFGNGGDVYVVDLDLPDTVAVPHVEGLFTYPDILCFTNDTAFFHVPLANIGYAPMTIQSVEIDEPANDQCWVEYGPSIVGEVVLPGDTVIQDIRIITGIVELPWEGGTWEMNIGTDAGDVGTFLSLEARECAAIPAADSLAEGPDEICACVDTVLISFHVSNAGFEAFYVDSIVVVCDADDCWTSFSSAQFQTPVAPQNSRDFDGMYYICDMNWDVHGSSFEIYATDTVMHSAYRPDYIADCLPVGESPRIATEYRLSSVYPNPFNNSARIEFSLPRESRVTLTLFDILGREAGTLVNNEFQTAGSHAVQFDGVNLSTGVYLIRLESEFGVRTTKAVLLK